MGFIGFRVSGFQGLGFRVSRGIGKFIRDTSTKGQAYRRNSLGIACSEDLYRVLKRLNTSGYEKTWEEMASNGLPEEEQKAHTARLKEETQGRQMKLKSRSSARTRPSRLAFAKLTFGNPRKQHPIASNNMGALGHQEWVLRSCFIRHKYNFLSLQLFFSGGSFLASVMVFKSTEKP